jgi:hypothetical protein
MNISRTLQALGLMAGIAGLFAGLFLLDGEPLFGVLSILGAMAVVLDVLTNWQT